MDPESKVFGCCNEMMSREATTGAGRLVEADR